MNPRVRTWHGQMNTIDGRVRIFSEEVGFLLDANTGEPAMMTQAEARHAADFMCQMDPAKNPLAERVS